MTRPRKPPTVWVKPLAKLLGGADHCEWSAWFQAHHSGYSRVASNFDDVSWQIDHTRMLREMVAELDEYGYSIRQEGQNKFALVGPRTGIVLTGKPDIIAVKDDTCLIMDVKTGKPYLFHQIQVMIYMWAVPRALPQYAGLKLAGRVVYKDAAMMTRIPPSKINGEFVTGLGEILRRLADYASPARKVACFEECQYCPITAADCPEKVLAANAPQTSTDIF